ncbi:MAG: mechanosensitive ion channel [Calditrichia bacterium]
MDSLQNYTDKAVELLMLYVPKAVLAILVLLIGLWIIRLMGRGLNKSLEKSKIEPSLQHFLSSLFTILLKILLLISVASMVGIATTSFVAILGAAGLAVGLALQGSLANFAGGVLLLLFKPFKVGDFIETQGYLGAVHSIQIFNTVLKTPDNKTVILPNGAVSGGSITNFSTEPQRRVDMTFGIGYSDDIDKAREIIQRLILQDSRILANPEPMVAVSELADSSVNFTVRVWGNSGDYWGIYFDMHEKVKKSFDAEGVSIPFPQRDVHLFQNS